MTVQENKTNRDNKINKEDIIFYLKNHPNFIIDNIDILSLMLPPSKKKDSILDMQEHMILNLQKSIKKFKNINSKILKVAEENFETSSKVHKSIIEIINANDYDSMIKTITTEVPKILNIEKIALFFIEEINIKKLKSSDDLDENKNINYYFKKNNNLFFTNNNQDILFKSKFNILSQAVIKISLKSKKDNALIILGSKKISFFNENQSNDLLSFFGNIVSLQLSKCLQI
tara:strand:+ start:7 stop:696 length:690 start_codon:yes stop_codon:yes gene_type:complete